MLPATIQSMTFTLPVRFVRDVEGRPIPACDFHVGSEMSIHGLPGRWTVFACWLSHDRQNWWVQTKWMS
jgi:hypothetical protein